MIIIAKTNDVVCHLFIRMSFFHSGHNIILEPGWKYYLHFYFAFVVLTADLSYVRICARSSLKSSRALCIKAAFTVVADMPAPRFENGGAHLVRLVNRHKSEKFF